MAICDFHNFVLIEACHSPLPGVTNVEHVRKDKKLRRAPGINFIVYFEWRADLVGFMRARIGRGEIRLLAHTNSIIPKRNK